MQFLQGMVRNSTHARLPLQGCGESRATASAAGPRPLHSRVADSRHCCKLILAFVGTPTCHLCIFVFFGTLRNITKGTWGSRPGFLPIFANFVAHGCYLACLMPLLWRPGAAWDDPETILGGSWDDPGTLEATRKDPVRYRLGFYQFVRDFGDPF